MKRQKYIYYIRLNVPRYVICLRVKEYLLYINVSQDVKSQEYILYIRLCVPRYVSEKAKIRDFVLSIHRSHLRVVCALGSFFRTGNVGSNDEEARR